MKAKLHKMVSGYILSLNGDIDDPYAIVNEELAQDYGWRRLSLRNCQAIERGYDLDELAKEGVKFHEQDEIHRPNSEHLYKKGFQKALELMGDKKFSEDDMIRFMQFIISQETLDNASSVSTVTAKYYLDNFQSLQQTEWDVEVEMEKVPVKMPGIMVFTKAPKLDATGCIILKRI